MTTTNVFQGIDTGAKPSSRVLAPPGGGSSDIFGAPEPVRAAAGVRPKAKDEGFCYGSDPSRPPQEMQRSQEPSAVPPHKLAPEAPAQTGQPTMSYAEQNYQRNAQSGDRIFGAGPVVQSRSGKAAGAVNPITGETNNNPSTTSNGHTKSKEGAYNPITGQSSGQSSGQEQEAPFTRVRQPPGGTSQPLW